MDRRAIAVTGIVQGVGFRPFVHDLANRLGLPGFVRNESGGVLIEVEGESESLDRFVGELTASPPPLARIDDVRSSSRQPTGDRHFRIESSRHDGLSSIFVAADVGTCSDCLRELFDPGDRRYRYPFLNCTRCGPRLTIIREAPYDRQRTTMASFAMCAACRAEYEDSHDRRFHAQPIACRLCGPQLAAVDSRGERVDTADALAFGVASLREGKIVAIKGLGGYHLACRGRRGGRGRIAQTQAPRSKAAGDHGRDHRSRPHALRDFAGRSRDPDVIAPTDCRAAPAFHRLRGATGRAREPHAGRDAGLYAASSSHFARAEWRAARHDQWKCIR